MNRRNFFRNTALATGGLLVGNASARADVVKPRRSLRIAHLTDIHVMPGKGAAEGMAKAFQHAQSLSDRPDFIFNGGDCIMDALKHEKAEVAAQWSEWQGVLKNERELPMYSAIGNHDVWGWALKDRARRGDYGKRWAMEELGLDRRYYAFEKKDWQFVALDSAHVDLNSERGYTARLDEEQFAWLQDTLERFDANKPVCVLSHIPIISFCPFFDGENETSSDWVVPGPWMHIDARRIKDLFARHPNVKVGLSGHIHLADEVKYLGVTYLCNGAVSGGWWDGNYQEFPPAYVIVDLYEDGSVRSQYVPYLA
ncbi:metallophosphoesterase [Pelagicoccus sp. SDUM812003]|uniref:metallophosphoesterase family protein n=1 Tax=Pelagicoccus sp. SDUM812003 TaxID=3041267 RepID=UPI00281001F2|nr:metallophosphoesterase [Pelagicoccus sp. SDUM812003]MDQ8202283.1 metallophosphoesterase [Pelagicoccus sp. SDUM812003]